jgi:hypothetical protein
MDVDETQANLLQAATERRAGLRVLPRRRRGHGPQVQVGGDTTGDDVVGHPPRRKDTTGEDVEGHRIW